VWQQPIEEDERAWRDRQRHHIGTWKFLRFAVADLPVLQQIVHTRTWLPHTYVLCGITLDIYTVASSQDAHATIGL
jgi:hypothetical protein